MSSANYSELVNYEQQVGKHKKSFEIINMVYEQAIKTNQNVDFSKWWEEIKISAIS